MHGAIGRDQRGEEALWGVGVVEADAVWFECLLEVSILVVCVGGDFGIGGVGIFDEGDEAAFSVVLPPGFVGGGVL